LASKLPHPALYVPLTLGMHYLQDWIPHWDVGTGLSNGTRRRSTALMLEMVDLGVAVGLVWWWFGGGVAGVHVWIGALIGIMPDLWEAPRNFLKWEPWFLKPLNEFHGRFHHSVPDVLFGLVPQVVLLAVIWRLR
jgi:hypothetical protein